MMMNTDGVSAAEFLKTLSGSTDLKVVFVKELMMGSQESLPCAGVRFAGDYGFVYGPESIYHIYVNDISFYFGYYEGGVIKEIHHHASFKNTFMTWPSDLQDKKDYFTSAIVSLPFSNDYDYNYDRWVVLRNIDLFEQRSYSTSYYKHFSITPENFLKINFGKKNEACS